MYESIEWVYLNTKALFQILECFLPRQDFGSSSAVLKGWQYDCAAFPDTFVGAKLASFKEIYECIAIEKTSFKMVHKQNVDYKCISFNTERYKCK